MKRFKKYISILRISVENHFAYFANFIIGTAFFVFILFVMAQLWKAIYMDRALIEGFSLIQVIWYLIMTETVVLSRSNFHTEINNTIKSGDISYLLIRPYNFLGYYLFNSLGEIIPKLAAHLLIGILVGLTLTGTMGLDVHFPLVVVSILLGVVLNFFFYMALALTAFWTEDNTAFFFIYSKLVFVIGGMLIPIDFLPGWLQGVSKALPFVYVTYWPARLAVSFDWALYGRVLAGQMAYVIAAFLLASWIYRRGVKQVNVNGG